MLMLESRQRVLVVDDEDHIRMFLRLEFLDDDRLEICGEAVDGTDALVQVMSLEPDAVLLDLSMPRLSGIDVLPLLRELRPAMRIVVYSADDDAEVRSLAAGADAFVPKDGDASTIAAMLLGLNAADLRSPAPAVA